MVASWQQVVYSIHLYCEPIICWDLVLCLLFSSAAQKHLSLWRALDQPLARLFLSFWICSEAKVRGIDELGILLEEIIKCSSSWVIRQKQVIIFKASGLTIIYPSRSIIKAFSDYTAKGTGFWQKALSKKALPLPWRVVIFVPGPLHVLLSVLHHSTKLAPLIILLYFVLSQLSLCFLFVYLFFVSCLESESLYYSVAPGEQEPFLYCSWLYGKCQEYGEQMNQNSHIPIVGTRKLGCVFYSSNSQSLCHIVA